MSRFRAWSKRSKMAAFNSLTLARGLWQEMWKLVECCIFSWAFLGSSFLFIMAVWYLMLVPASDDVTVASALTRAPIPKTVMTSSLGCGGRGELEKFLEGE